MKKVILVFALTMSLSGCAWFKSDRGSALNGDIAGPDPGRGTTGVSSGADAAPSTTGSDLAPP